MRPGRGLAAATALGCAVAAVGCGFGAGASSIGTAKLAVTRDYGSQRLVAATDRDPPESETVLRLLDREADITTRYGGGFVQSIEGLSGAERAGRRYDWFFYVNGIESPVGSADVRVRAGDSIWWDYRDWTDAMRVPAVVGSWPQPFAGSPHTTAVRCAGSPRPCGTAARRLRHAGVDARVRPMGGGSVPGAPSMLVGRWASVRRDPAAAQIDEGPATSGVFARFAHAPSGRWSLVALDAAARPARRLGPAAGLVAAVRDGDAPPTWVVTGGREAAVAGAARLLDGRDLEYRYAAAARHGEGAALPVAPRQEGAG